MTKIDTRQRVHPQHGELFTPWGPALLALLTRMHDEHGSWRRVAEISETRLRLLRYVRHGRSKALSQSFVDRLITTTGVGSIDEFEWFTPEDLIELGVWLPPQYVEGDRRIKDGVVTIAPNHGHKRPEVKAYEKGVKRRKKRAERLEHSGKNELGIKRPKWLQ